MVVVDDCPNTGTTVRLMLDLLARRGVPSDRITVAIPRHPARPEWTLPQGATGANGVRLVALEPGELYKARCSSRPRCSRCSASTRAVPGKSVSRRAPRCGRSTPLSADNSADGFQVRFKRVFEVRSDATGESTIQRVFVKSVGWGWLGYHAYFMGARLAGGVPRLFGLRNGLLLTEWLDEASACPTGDVPDHVVDAIAHYTARRAEQFPLPKDPCFDTPEYRWTGWNELVSILRGVYGPYVGRLKAHAVRRRLGRFLSPVPRCSTAA